MLCREIIKILQEQSPEGLACEWDNVGLQVGSPDKEVRCVCIALDATDETIAEAAEAGADLLLTHHPMIFRGLKKVNSEDFIGRRVIKLIVCDMAYYAMHTNFDIQGMADLAAERLKLTQTAPLQPVSETQGIGKVGMLPVQMTLGQCAEEVKRAFDIDTVKVFGNLEGCVRRAAVCPGSGKSVISDSLRAGAEVLITGDIDHHEGIDAAAQGMAVIDAGHYGVEKMFIPYMAKYLEARLDGVRVVAQAVKQPFTYI